MPASYDARSIEARWSRAWDAAGCHRAPELPPGPKFYNYDSGPFPNGPLHMGHVRTYLLGDVTARFERARGKSVLYCTEWDSFGLPNEIEAQRARLSPREYTRRWSRKMETQLRTLGVSYDWSRVRDTSDPDYYKWTQWAFLRLHARKLVVRRESTVPFCPSCGTTLSEIQVVDGCCWRCDTRVHSIVRGEWVVLLDAWRDELSATLDDLDGWSRGIVNLVRGLMHSMDGRGAVDWVVSRQRSWGTPVPMIECAVCGFRPVAEHDLPVRLPEDLNWELGANALESHPVFRETDCPTCGGPALRETDTLDCFFDDVWCQLAPLVDLRAAPGFRTPGVEAWFPVDRFHSGVDTVAYLQLHRFFCLAFYHAGELSSREPILGHEGYEMVLREGRKMSNHFNNAVSPSRTIRRHGADAVRLAVLRAARPSVAMEWRAELVERAAATLDEIWEFYTGCGSADSVQPVGPSAGGEITSAATGLARKSDAAFERMARFVERQRPNAAIDTWERSFRASRAFAMRRVPSGRLSGGDAAILEGILKAQLVTLGLFAPHLAEELWHRRGQGGYVVQQPWPANLRQADLARQPPQRPPER